MTRDGGESAWDTLRAYATVVRRHVWVVVLVTLLVPSLVVFLSKLQDPVYEASSKVLVNQQNLAATLSGVTDTLADPVRFMQTQAGLARTTEVARRTLESTNPSHITAQELLASSSVSADAESDLLVFSVEAPVVSTAVSMANAYALSYTQYRNSLETAPYRGALAGVTKRINALRRDGESNSALFSALQDEQQKLETLQALKTDSAKRVDRALGAPQIRPQTKKRAELALVFGLFLGLGLAFALEASSRRLRSPDAIPARLQLPILGRIPPLSKDRLPVMTEPSGIAAEAYRILRMNIEFATTDRDVRVIMVTSAMEGEGKSTTAANLAITQARAGRSVVLVDADFLRPSQAELFALSSRPGLGQVSRGETDLSRALKTIRVPERGEGQPDPGRWSAPLTVLPRSQRLAPADRSASSRESDGLLRLLTTDEAPLDSTEAMVRQKLPAILEQLKEAADLVIIDAPPLGTSVTLSLGSVVDAVLVVANTQLLQESILDELAHSLDELPAEKLGLVLTAVHWYPRGAYGYRRPGRLHEPTDAEQAPFGVASDQSS